MSAKLRLVNVDRGTWNYSANIEWNGRIVGYVQKRRGAESYYAYAGGQQVARSRTLAELREDLRELFIEEPPVFEDEEVRTLVLGVREAARLAAEKEIARRQRDAGGES